MFDVLAADNDARGVPVTDGIGLLRGRRRNQIVERGQGAIAVAAELRVGMPLVVEDLVLAADGRTAAGFGAGAGDGVEVGLDEILDAAVRARREFEIGDEFEIGETFARDDVAAGGGFLAVVFQNGEDTVFDDPAFGGKRLGAGAAPAVRGLPSQSRRQPSRFSCSVSVLDGGSVAAVLVSCLSRTFRKRTCRPLRFVFEPMPCTCKAMKPRGVRLSVISARATPLSQVLMEGPELQYAACSTRPVW
jgi:hypothetical protein